MNDGPGVVELSGLRDARYAREVARLAAAHQVHDRIAVRLRESRRREFKRAVREGLSVEQIAEVTGLPTDGVRAVLET